MPTQVQFRRGTTVQNDAFTGAEGEISVDTTLDHVRLHDGSTQGGFRLARYSELQDGDITAVVAGTGLAGGATSGSATVSLSHLGIESLSDPNADRIVFWDDSAGASQWLTAGTGLSISATTITVGTLNQDTTGTAALATSITVSANNSTDETTYPVFVDGATGTQGAETDTGLSYNPSSGLLTTTSVAAALTGNVTGNVSGSSGSTTGNAATATALETARTIGGTSFDGTANIAVGLAATATALASARTIHGVSFDGTANIDLSEVISDTVGAMVSSNTESGITVAYDDGDNTIDFTVGTLNQNTTGNAATATALATARTIGGVSFDGTANINLPGVNAAGNQSTTGLAATATALATGRTIGSTGDVVWTSASFDGSGNVTGTATIQANSVALGTDTTGNYMTDASAGTGVSVTHTPAEGSTATIAIGQAVATDSNVQFNNVTVSGDLDVNGTTTTIDSTNLTVTDALIELANGTSGTPGNDAGLVIERGSADNAFIGYDESADKFTVGTGTFTGASTGNLGITAGTLVANLEGDVTGDLTGNADTATTATTATNVTASANNSTDETTYPTFIDGATGGQGIETDTGLTYNPSSGLLTSTLFAGALTGNVTGNASGSSGSTTGNAATATALETARTIGGTSFDGTANIAVGLAATSTALASARTIGGVSFDGTANINLPGVNAAGTQNTSGNAATATLAVDATTLATARTIHGVSFDGSANIDLSEVVSDTVGAMVTSNTETGITVTYQDSDNTLDFVIGTLNQSTTGNAATATALATARTIASTGDVVWNSGSFDGSGNVTAAATIQADAVEQSMMADDAVGYDELENVQSLIIYSAGPTTATANCNGAISGSIALVVDGNSGTIAVGMIVSGTGVETANAPSVITVTDQNNLVLSHAQSISNDVALTFTQSLKILRTAGDE